MSTKLIFCKSYVEVHPTISEKDHRTGFLVITNDAQLSPQDAIISWLDKRELSSEQQKHLHNAEVTMDRNSNSNLYLAKDVVMQAMYSSWSFSIKLSYIAYVQFLPPHPNGWYQGSVTIEPKDANDAIPVLYFQDDQCPSTKSKRRNLIDSFQPLDLGSDVYWGGADVKMAISSLVSFRPTQNDPNIYLVNASAEELQSFSKAGCLRKRSAAVIKNGKEGDPWKGIQSYGWNAMATIATITSKSASLLGTLARKHPLVQLAERNSNHPYIRKLLDNPRVQDVQRDFDSAKIYLAKWSLGVKEQAEKYRIEESNNDAYRRALMAQLGKVGDFSIPEEELNAALDRSEPLDLEEWESFKDKKGRLYLSKREILDRIFHRGLKDTTLRRKVWPYLLNVFPWSSSTEERKNIEQKLRNEYENEWKLKWLNQNIMKGTEQEVYWNDQVFRIEKDVKRNDRNLELYKHNTVDGKPLCNPQEDKKSSDDEQSCAIPEDDGALINPHLLAIRNILLTYNIYNENLGYVQGMTDLVSTLYCVLQDEAMTFWCFVHFMERMERNFLRDQSGIRDQMVTLAALTQLMLPVFSAHLEKCDSSNYFFCFRMLLIWFKREFNHNDLCSIWEVFWTDYYTSQFHLFFMLAVFQKSSKSVITYLTQLDEVLKYFNDLQGCMNWKDLVVRAELLFIHFRNIINFKEANTINKSSKTFTTGYERQNSYTNNEQDKKSDTSLDNLLKGLLSTTVIVQKEGKRASNSIK